MKHYIDIAFKLIALIALAVSIVAYNHSANTAQNMDTLISTIQSDQFIQFIIQRAQALSQPQ